MYFDVSRCISWETLFSKVVQRYLPFPFFFSFHWFSNLLSSKQISRLTCTGEWYLCRFTPSCEHKLLCTNPTERSLSRMSLAKKVDLNWKAACKSSLTLCFNVFAFTVSFGDLRKRIYKIVSVHKRHTFLAK